MWERSVSAGVETYNVFFIRPSQQRGSNGVPLATPARRGESLRRLTSSRGVFGCVGAIAGSVCAAVVSPKEGP